MSLSNIMRKATGLFIEMPPELESAAPTNDDLPAVNLPPEARPSSLGAGSKPVSSASGAKSIEQIVREAKGPNLDEIKVDATQIPANVGAPGGILNGDKIDFAAIYRAAKLTEPAFGAEQMLDTLASLPPELPLATRRATVRAMLSTLGKATGATPESVVADASRKLAALESFENYMAKKTADAVALNEKEIAELEKQISTKRQAMEKAKGELLKISNGCDAEADRIDDVLEFFSLDTRGSKLAPPVSASQSPMSAPQTSAPSAPINPKIIPATPATIRIPTE